LSREEDPILVYSKLWVILAGKTRKTVKRLAFYWDIKA
jgi:hypothetical protein